MFTSENDKSQEKKVDDEYRLESSRTYVLWIATVRVATLLMLLV